ncbi:hypothetical protein KSP40_PGU011513 [Platanthera guangdongensis]|uniref:Uncharacterized protein n=1 Tax=Platanthera guangdongensis TaxID=2320717 RepID=A0ABR2LBD6_9ASPA
MNFVGYYALCIFIVSDVGTWKTSLILATVIENFSENMSRVLPHILLDEDYCPDPVPFGIIDTSSRKAISIQLCIRNYTFEHDLKVKVSIILVGCKLDLIGESNSTIMKNSLGSCNNFL